MKDIVPKDSRYIPFVQQKSSCAVACISMVMYRRGIPLMPQELLGHHLGLVVAPKNKKFFWNARTGKKPKSGYGTQLATGKYDINKIFAKLKIPLKMQYHPISKFTKIEDFKSYILNSLKKDKDVLVCYHWGAMNNESDNDGHLSVIDRVYKNQVRFIDPSSHQPKWRLVSFNKLKKAMEAHGDKNLGGFWEFKKT